MPLIELHKAEFRSKCDIVVDDADVEKVRTSGWVRGEPFTVSPSAIAGFAPVKAEVWGERDETGHRATDLRVFDGPDSGTREVTVFETYEQISHLLSAAGARIAGTDA